MAKKRPPTCATCDLSVLGMGVFCAKCGDAFERASIEATHAGLVLWVSKRVRANERRRHRTLEKLLDARSHEASVYARRMADAQQEAHDAKAKLSRLKAALREIRCEGED